MKKGLLKIMSKMGISTMRSYFGAQIFEAVGLGKRFIESYFTHTASRIGGIGIEEVAAEAAAMHRVAFPRNGAKPKRLLDIGGFYHVRVGGEKHLWNPDAIYKLQQAVRSEDYRAFRDVITSYSIHYTKLYDSSCR